ncbi:MAG: DNA repair protein RecO [Bdellovibrionales bacterium]|nr:DNA repair protein RecO [Bdellovibrionales bacterium]
MTGDASSFSQPAIVLGVRPLGESDMVVQLLGATTGKLSAVARHARSSKRRFFSSVDVFDCGTFEFERPRSTRALLRLQHISNRQTFPGLRSNLSALAHGSMCLEVTERFSAEEDPDGGALFRPLFAGVRALSAASDTPTHQAITVYYCLRLLQSTGFSLLDGTTAMSPDCRRWFEAMVDSGAPIVPHLGGLTSEGIQTTIRWIEGILGSALKTTPAALRPAT